MGPFSFEQTGRREGGRFAAAPDHEEHALKRYVRHKTPENDRELLARERAETERLFIAKVLASADAKGRRRPSRGWIIKPALVPISDNLSDIFLGSTHPAQED
jgi:hypothetical protein